MKTFITLFFATVTLTFASCMGGSTSKLQPEAVVEESVIEVAIDTTTAPMADTTTVRASEPAAKLTK